MSATTSARRPSSPATGVLAELRPADGWSLPAQTVELHPIEDTNQQRRPHAVRVVVDGQETTHRFRTWIEADTFHAAIERARTTGERFNPDTGRPTSWPTLGGARPVDVDLEHLGELIAAYDPTDDHHWRAQAACTGVGTNRFYPERGGDLGPARAVCRSCPVAQRCLISALARGEKFGIWGGLSERERRRIRRALSAARHRPHGVEVAQREAVA